MPQADDHYVRVQSAGDDEVQELEERHMEHHRATPRRDPADLTSGGEAERTTTTAASSSLG